MADPTAPTDPLLPALLELWAVLRGAHHLYWTLHWQSRGPAFYADHELFQRLYEGRTAEIDRIAEVIAALFGAQNLAPTVSLSYALNVVKALVTKPPTAIPAAIAEACAKVNAAIGQRPHGLGVQNAIAGIADAAVEQAYLLRQRETA